MLCILAYFIMLYAKIRYTGIYKKWIKVIIQENERLCKENDALSGKVASLKQFLNWLRKKMFGRMS